MGRVVSVILVAVFSFTAQSKSIYPKNPDPRLTPGSVCKHANDYRYPERVAYCNRNVDRFEKQQVIRKYEQQLGYRIDRGQRGSFKIDHLIPLCAGGSNEMDNLWPQHKTVYEVTDPVEPLICEKMAEGRLMQVRAIELIYRAKNDLSQVARVIAELNSL